MAIKRSSLHGMVFEVTLCTLSFANERATQISKKALCFVKSFLSSSFLTMSRGKKDVGSKNYKCSAYSKYETKSLRTVGEQDQFLDGVSEAASVKHVKLRDILVWLCSLDGFISVDSGFSSRLGQHRLSMDTLLIILESIAIHWAMKNTNRQRNTKHF